VGFCGRVVAKGTRDDSSNAGEPAVERCWRTDSDLKKGSMTSVGGD